MSTVIDSSVWIDYLTGRSTAQTVWLENEMLKQRLAITDLILCEVLQGIRSETDFQQIRAALLKYEILSTGGAELALRAAENYRFLRSKGVTVRKTIDNLIATCCISNDAWLLHNDHDFDGFEQYLNLQVIHP